MSKKQIATITDNTLQARKTVTTYFCTDHVQERDDHMIGAIEMPDDAGRPMMYGLYLHYYEHRPYIEAVSFDGASGINLEPDTDTEVGQCSVTWREEELENFEGDEGSYAAVTVSYPADYDRPFLVEAPLSGNDALPAMFIELLKSVAAGMRTTRAMECTVEDGEPVLRYGIQLTTDIQASVHYLTDIRLETRATDVSTFLRATFSHRENVPENRPENMPKAQIILDTSGSMR